MFLPKFNRTLSPQGDGNRDLPRRMSANLSCSTEPFPRKGTETGLTDLRSSNPKYLVQQNPFPARGRKLIPDDRASTVPRESSSSTEPFPRKGTETMRTIHLSQKAGSLFNRTLSPQGDGNSALVNVGASICKRFNRTLSPQGDGNTEKSRSGHLM